MSEVIGEGIVRIRTDETGADFGTAGSKAGGSYKKGFGSSLKGLGGMIAGAVVAGATVGFAKASVGEAREAQKVTAQTAATIKATGGAAKISAEQVADLAGALSAKTGVDDEAIQQGANLLLTFKNVRNEVGKGADIFNRATASAGDLAAAGFGSIGSASKMLGKALNDPVKGMSAMSRAGVTFTESQQEQVKALVASGDMLGAQKIILGEVESQVGGVAEATATAGDKASVAWGNIKETVGNGLLPVLDALANLFVGTIAPALTSAAEALGPIFRGVGDAIKAAFPPGLAGEASGFASTIATQVTPIFEALGAVFRGDVLPMVSELITGLIGALWPALQNIAGVFTGTVLPAIIGVASYIASALWPILQRIVGIITGQVIPILGQLAQFFTAQVLPAVIAIVQEVGTRLKPVFDSLVKVVRDTIIPAVENLVARFRDDLLPVLQPLILRIVGVVGAILRFAAAILAKVLPPIFKLVGWIIQRLVPVLVTLISWVVKIINWVLDFGGAIVKAIAWFARFGATITGLVRGALTALFNAVAGLPGRLLGLGQRFLDTGKAIIQKFVDGLKGAAGLVSDVAGRIWDTVRGLLNSAIGKINAALEFRIEVFGKGVTIDPPDIPTLQRGTQAWAGGTALVGEVGPERVYLPSGARVLTAAQTRQTGTAGLDYDALATAIVAAMTQVADKARPVQFVLPSGDPEAAAMATLNRLATV